MAKTLKIIALGLVLWLAAFLIWEWWQSYPKVRAKPVLKSADLKSGIDSILSKSIPEFLLPGVSLAIVKDGKVIYLNALGYENLESKDSLKVHSKIPVASVSKLFTALGLAHVMAEDSIPVSSPVNTLLSPGLSALPPIQNHNFRHFLSHRSGLRDQNYREMIFRSGKTIRLEEWARDFLAHSATYYSDSSRYHYADSNFDLIGYFLARHKGEDFDLVMHENLFSPAGMLNSEFVKEWPMPENALQGYEKTFLWKRSLPTSMRFGSLPSPSSGLVTTTADMSLAMIHLLRGEMGIFQEELAWLTESKSGPILGFQELELNGSLWMGHFGGQAGFSSFLFFSKQKNMGIFLFANTRDQADFRLALAGQIESYISQKFFE
ncbi:serine hydrolase [Algoriphagus halophytocola]|uniref:Beta-lactamase family protein n=1 Tax=Algoriphagus halophytocola TaxID=2991499 RepID=A0ABY6MKS4_9BACT|nr:MULTISPECIES: serine hydrolase [unclassified Algoriphagus]UZD23773.1 beta-lactamase family protein [Algoriphagus sp. TR-M5]WBL45067.1 serine hydrolase [Algoriphagus sp. TR-M9]